MRKGSTKNTEKNPKYGTYSNHPAVFNNGQMSTLYHDLHICLFLWIDSTYFDKQFVLCSKLCTYWFINAIMIHILILANLKNCHGQYSDNQISRCSKIGGSLGNGVEEVFSHTIMDKYGHTSKTSHFSDKKMYKNLSFFTRMNICSRDTIQFVFIKVLRKLPTVFMWKNHRSYNADSLSIQLD